AKLLQGRHVFIWDQTRYTVYAGSGEEAPTAAAAVGYNTLLAGWTTSPDFPLIGAGSLQPRFGGGARDGWFITNYGQGYVGSYLGGSGDDTILAVAADPANSNSFYLAGESTSPDFPVASALQPALAGGKDGFLTHITSGRIDFSTYWGGSGDDSILAVDATAASCWIAGRTSSPDLKVKNPTQPQLGGASDGFLARI